MPAAAHRFEIRRQLGAGGMGLVYEAFDRERGHRVALKRLPELDPTRLYLFKNEFRAVADVNHPNVVQLYELMTDDEGWFFTMELVEGVDLMQWVCPHGAEEASRRPSRSASFAVTPTRTAISSSDDGSGDDLVPKRNPPRAIDASNPDMDRLRSALEQLTLGVMALHRAGVVHRDLKPSNIMVTPGGHLTICDFGIATDWRHRRRDDVLERRSMGTAAYSAPEQAMSLARLPASDCYSVGVILYEALVGCLPFGGATADAVLLAKLTELPIAPRSLRPDLPPELSELCVGLLQPAPDERDDGAAILATLRRSIPAPSLRTDRQGALVARDREWDALRRAFKAAKQGRASAVRVHGGPGMGKSTLVTTFLRSLSEQEGDALMALEARSYERETVPFKALDSAIDDLARHLVNMGEDAERLLPPETDALAAMFPVLRRVPAIGDPTTVSSDLSLLRRRAATALRELLLRFGETRCVVLFLEDVQWGDSDSARLLAEIMRPPFETRMLVILSHRDEEAAASSFLENLRDAGEELSALGVPTTDLALGVLDQDQAETMARALLDPAHRDVATRVAKESRGNPLFIESLCRYVISDAHGANTDSVLTLTEVLRRRFAALDAGAKALLEAICLTTRPTPSAVLRHAADLGPEWERAWSALHADHLARVTSDDGGAVEPFHGRIREVLVEQIPEDRARSIHRRLADAIERCAMEDGPDPALVAHHRARADQLALALPHAIRAAERALAQYAFESASAMLDVATRAVAAGEADRATRRHIADLEGDVAGYLGQFDRATSAYRRARSKSSTERERAEVDFKIASITLRRGRAGDAVRVFERMLDELGVPVARGKRGFVAGMVSQGTRQIAHSLLRDHVLGRRGDRPGWRDALLADLFSAYSQALYIDGDMRSIWAHLTGLNLIERYGPTAELARAWCEHGMAMLTIGNYDRAHAYGERGLAIAEELADPTHLGEALNRWGAILYARSHWDEAIGPFERAAQIHRRTGDTYQAFTSQNHLALIYLRKGDLRAAIAEARQTYEQATAIGDTHGPATALMVWALASGGDIPEGALAATKAAAPDRLTRALLTRGEAAVLLREGRPQAAIDHLEETWLPFEEHRVVITYVWAALPADLATAYRHLAEAAPDRRTRRRALKAAKRHAQVAVRHARFFTNDLPQALREAGHGEALAGHLRRAHAAFDESLRTAEAQGACLEAALTKQADALLERKARRPGATQRLERVHAELEDLGAAFHIRT